MLADDIEITPEMIEAGEDAVSGMVGDLGGYFSASALAEKVYRAMDAAKKSNERQHPSPGRA